MISFKINDKSKDAKALIEFLRSLEFVTITEEKKAKTASPKVSKKAVVEKNKKSKKDKKGNKKLLS